MWSKYLQLHHKELTDLEEQDAISMEDKNHYLELKGKYKGEECIVGLEKDWSLSFTYDVINVNVYVDGNKVAGYSEWA